MNSLIKNSIDVRKNAICYSYEVKSDLLKNKIENLFKKIREFGENCKDVADFETKFASSSLSTEYTNLIMEVANSCAEAVKPHKTEVRDIVKQEIKQTGTDILRNTPVGKIMQIKQTLNLLKKIKGDKKE